jgi:hypothetical protein
MFMQAKATRWAALALAGSVSGQALGQVPSIYVPPAPVHQLADDQPGAEPAGSDADQAPPPLPSPPRPYAGPQVAIARRVIDAAGAFDGYMRRASAIKAEFRSGGAVARAVELGAVYEPAQLEQGAIAYAALVALQDPAFVAIVQDVGRNPRVREAFVARLFDRPATVLDAAAARTSAAHVAGVLGRMGAQLAAAGGAVTQAAYDVQHEDWSRGAIVDAGERLARIKAQSAVAVSLMPRDTAQLISGVTALRAADAGALGQSGEISPVVMRGMAIAALAILGEASEDQAERIAALMSDPADAHCIKMAKLDLFQCLAVAGPHYENLYCLGHHGMAETGACIVSASGVSDPALTMALDRRSVLVPVAGEPAQQIERDSVFHPGAQPAAPDSSGIAMPLAAQPAPVNYSPYAGPAAPTEP